jgi:hypothetical protein
MRQKALFRNRRKFAICASISFEEEIRYWSTLHARLDAKFQDEKGRVWSYNLCLQRKPTTNHCRQPALQLSDGNAKKAADFLRIPLPRDATVPLLNGSLFVFFCPSTN